MDHIGAWREALQHVKQEHYNWGRYEAESKTDQELKVLDEIEVACRKQQNNPSLPATTCAHSYEARAVDGGNSAHGPFKAVCRFCNGQAHPFGGIEDGAAS
jgi:hypothetical protein